MKSIDERTTQWLYFADNDLLTAGALHKDGIWNQVCYHAQQAVEKILKGYMKANNINFRRTHDLPIRL